MKKLTSYWYVLLLILTMGVTVQSCIDLDDDDDNSNTALTIGTLKIIAGKDYYFALDNGKKMYPGDTTYIHNYTPVDNQRVFIYFQPLKQPATGYDYNVQLYRLENILTKDIIPLTEQTADSIGDDRINPTNVWITGNYLNIEYQLYTSNNVDKKHMLNMVINETKTPSDNDSDYFNLEFRHNAYNDKGTTLAWGVVSFRLDKIADRLSGKKGLKIRYNSIYEGDRYTTVNIGSKSSQ